ncbi:putative F420-0 ABC transporter substrate-binding protein [Microbacterium sp. NPDC058342]|uniref:putative F420-0 ABC transporter substrate-binding protein n=1 Tax=Microbacterium sp. NPDC058342 TaxID=3346454 RepID=UPI0036470825
MTAVAAAFVTGCTSAPATAEPSADAYPLTLDNCGFETTFDKAPERVVTIKSSTTELLLSLGLGDRIVAQAFSDGPVPDELRTEAESIEMLSEKVPSQEAVLSLEPDLVFAGWESNLTAEGAGERSMLDSLGVGTYVAPAACTEKGYAPNPLTFDDVFDGIAEAGRIFDVADAASALVDEQRSELAELAPDERGLTAVWYSSGRDTPFVGAGTGAPQMIMSAAGLENIFGDVTESWTSASWEAVADQDPDVLVLVDSAWNTADSKIELLRSGPVTSQLRAVRENRFLVVDFPATEAGVRNVSAVASLLDQLASS